MNKRNDFKIGRCPVCYQKLFLSEKMKPESPDEISLLKINVNHIILKVKRRWKVLCPKMF